MLLRFVGFVAVSKYLLIAKHCLKLQGKGVWVSLFVLNKMNKQTRRNKMFHEEVGLAGC